MPRMQPGLGSRTWIDQTDKVVHAPRVLPQGASDEVVASAVAPSADDPQPLTEEELAERDALLSGGFSNWSRRDFNAFVRACEKVRGCGAPASHTPAR